MQITFKKGYITLIELYKIGEISHITGVKAGTIRFYESCGFLEKVN